MIKMKKYNGIIIKTPKIPRWMSATDFLQVRVDIVDGITKKRLGKIPLKDLVRKVR